MLRDATHDLGLIRNEAGRAYGISLGWDYTAEHEGGIDPLIAMLRIGEGETEGIPLRQVKAPRNKIVRNLLFKDFPKATKTRPAETRLTLHPEAGHWRAGFEHRTSASWHLPVLPRPEAGLSAMWDKNGFSLRATGEEERAMLIALHAALLEGDVALGAGKAAPFGRAPLNLTIVSQLPPELAEAVLAADRDHAALMAAVDASGILERLKAAGCHTFGIKPHWAAFFKDWGDGKGPPKDRTDYSVVFFINPRDQRRNNHGWFTVEELDAWTRGEGPVPKAA